MFNPQPKPEFHTYPLRINDLSKLTQQMSQLDHDIYQNRKQIQQINKKFNQQQSQCAYVQRLHEKNRILQLKKQELQHINKMHQYHQNVENHQRQVVKSIHSNLVNEYKQQIQQNQRRKSQQKSMQKLRDKQIIEQNLRIVDKIEAQKERKRSQIYQMDVQQNKGIHDYLNKIKQEKKEKDKQQYLQLISRTQPTQKQLVFEQFYKKNQIHSEHSQKLYKTSTEPSKLQKLSQKIRIEEKNQAQYIQNLQKKAIQQQQRKAQNRESLKRQLQNQMDLNLAYKHNEKSTKLMDDFNRRSSQVDNERYEMEKRQVAKLSQHLYSKELAKQYNDQVQAQRQNGMRNRQHHYMNQSNDALVSRKEINSPESPKSGIFLGNQKNRNALHNPITNPIPFSIGMTNPYILKQYENKRVSSSFKTSNLAQLGDQSFRVN